MSSRKTPPKRRGRAKSPVLEDPLETKAQRGQRRKAGQTSSPNEETAIEPKQTSASQALPSDQHSDITQPLFAPRSRPRKRQVLPLSDEKTSHSRKKILSSPESGGNRSRGRSRSKSPKGKGRVPSTSNQDNIQTDKTLEDILGINVAKDRDVALKSQDNTIYIDVDEMETRSKTRQTPRAGTPSQSTPRSRRTSARTRPVIMKQEPLDDFITNSPAKKTALPTEAIAEFSDTPKHLYGLDNTMGMSSGEEEVHIDSDSSSHSPQNKIKEFFLQRSNKRCSCWCVSMAVAIMFIVIAVISAALLKPSPHMAVPTVQVNDGPDKGQDNESWNSKSLRELQEKLDQLSAQVSSSLKIMKEDTRIPFNESIDSKKHLSSYIEGLVKAKMDAALDVYSADKLGIPDYALESAGGQIHGSHHSPTYNTGASRKLFGFSLWYDGVPPRVILQPDNTPGTCWSFEGQEGYVVIRLSQAVVPDMFTVEHIPSSLSTEEDGKISNAPKDFSVWGWMDSEGHEKRCIGKYTYDNQGKSLQMFKAKEHSDQNDTLRYIELRVGSNHGHDTHTCIYRFRVHGKPAGPTVTPPTSCSDD